MFIVNVYNGYVQRPGQGGGIRYLRNLVQEQGRLGADVRVLGFGDGPVAEIAIGEAKVRYAPISRDCPWPRFMWQLVKHIARNRSQYKTAIFHIHRPYFAPAIRLLLPASRIVLTIHTHTFSVFADKHPELAWLVSFFICLERLILRTCVDRVTVASEALGQFYAARHRGICKNLDVLMCLHGVSEAPPMLIPEVRGRKFIVVSGRLAPVKRPLSALRLWAAAMAIDPPLRNTHCLAFIGDGELGAAMAREIQSLGLGDCVLALGQQASDQMPAIYAASQGLLLTSEQEGGGPYVVYEALACGKPVFSTAVGSVPDIVTPDSGIIIPVGQPETRVQELVRFLRTAYAPSACRARAEAYYDRCTTRFAQISEGIYD